MASYRAPRLGPLGEIVRGPHMPARYWFQGSVTGRQAGKSFALGARYGIGVPEQLLGRILRPGATVVVQGMDFAAVEKRILDRLYEKSFVVQQVVHDEYVVRTSKAQWDLFWDGPDNPPITDEPPPRKPWQTLNTHWGSKCTSSRSRINRRRKRS
jgi:hypothetical protein